MKFPRCVLSTLTMCRMALLRLVRSLSCLPGMAQTQLTAPGFCCQAQGTWTGQNRVYQIQINTNYIVVAAQSPYLAQGSNEQFQATEYFTYGGSQDITNAVTWASSDLGVATVNAAGVVSARSLGTVEIRASLGAITGSSTLNVLSTAPVGRYRVANAGLYTRIERRGASAGYRSGELIQDWNNFDPVVNSTRAQEASSQLDIMRKMGVNTITIELRTADTGSGAPFPTCLLPSVQGLHWPLPTPTELSNLSQFFSLVHSKGMRIWLQLINVHMEENPPVNSQIWLGAIFGVIGHHPALDLVLFGGNDLTIDTNGDGVADSCGTPAEAPLYMGPGSDAVKYVQWAIGFAMSQGIPSRKLSAEAIVGSYFIESHPPAGPSATNAHLWSPVPVLKGIFDNLQIPDGERTYALSFYEHRKCADAQYLPCTDADPDTWAQQTMQSVLSQLGPEAGARIVASEFGDLPGPTNLTWPAQHAVESLVNVMEHSKMDGGSFWRWASHWNAEDTDPQKPDPVKRRGVSFVFNPVQREILDMAGFHLNAIPNGSFEDVANQNVTPDNWTMTGNGTASPYLLTQEPGQPEVPSRGSYALRLTTGPGLSDWVSAASMFIPVSPKTSYTTTANLRFGWTGDPNPAGTPATRPQVYLTVRYLRPDGHPSSFTAQETFMFFQEDSTNGFGTFPLQYTTPPDAASVQIVFGAARNNLPTPIVLDVDNVR